MIDNMYIVIIYVPTLNLKKEHNKKKNIYTHKNPGNLLNFK